MADEVLPGYKKCATCGEVKPVAEFPLHDTTKRPRSPCKLCEADRCRKKANTPAGRASSNRRVRRYQKAHPDRVAASGLRYRESIRGDLARWMARVNLHNIRHQARLQGVLCDLTGVTVKAIYDRQDGKCALTGRELIFGSKGRQRDSMSLDRIEHGGNYSSDNVRLVTYQANMARGMFSDEELFAFCEAVLATRRESRV